jgi:hypothetical protein
MAIAATAEAVTATAIPAIKYMVTGEVGAFIICVLADASGDGVGVDRGSSLNGLPRLPKA